MRRMEKLTEKRKVEKIVFEGLKVSLVDEEGVEHKIETKNMLFWDVVKGVKEPKGDDYFIGKDEEGYFVAVLRLGSGRIMSVIDIERPEVSETVLCYVRYLPPFLAHWLGRIKAKILFKDLKASTESDVVG